MSDFRIGPTPGPSPADFRFGLEDKPRTKGFLDSMRQAIAEVEQDEAKSNQAITDLAVGRRKTLHETMIAVEKAEISFRMLLAVRNKMMAAYQEIMRMHF